MKMNMHTTMAPGMDMHNMTNMTHDGGHDTGHDTHTSAGHNLYFHISNKATILFLEWSVSTWQLMLVTCLAVAVVSALYEGLKVAREELLKNHLNKQKSAGGCSASACSCVHMLQTLLHMVQVTVSYCLMLVFMTFNLWLCLAVVGGAGLGYLAFGWRRAVYSDITEHCN